MTWSILTPDDCSLLCNASSVSDSRSVSEPPPVSERSRSRLALESSRDSCVWGVMCVGGVVCVGGHVCVGGVTGLTGVDG